MELTRAQNESATTVKAEPGNSRVQSLGVAFNDLLHESRFRSCNHRTLNYPAEPIDFRQPRARAFDRARPNLA